MSRFILIFFMTSMFSMTENNVYAGSCVEISQEKERLACYDQAISCSHIISADARLACYDGVYLDSVRTVSTINEISNDQRSGDVSVGSVQAATSEQNEVAIPGKSQPLEQNEVAIPGKSQPLEQNEEKNFGKKKIDETPTEYIESSIVEVKQDRRKIDYIRLQNGQVWRETEDFRVRFKIGQTVKIEKAILGSFNLRMDGVRKLIKVERVD